MIIIIFCDFFSNTILPTFRYWKIKIPIYSLYKKKLSSQQGTKGHFFVFFFYTEKVDKMSGRRNSRRRESGSGSGGLGIPMHLVSVL